MGNSRLHQGRQSELERGGKAARLGALRLPVRACGRWPALVHPIL